MAIDSLFDRGTLSDWQAFAQALRVDVDLAKETLLMAARHTKQGAAELARVLIEHFHPDLSLAAVGSVDRIRQQATGVGLDSQGSGGNCNE